MNRNALNRMVDNDGANVEGCVLDYLSTKRKNREDNSIMNNTKLLRNKWYARALGVSEETLDKVKAQIKAGRSYGNMLSMFRIRNKKPLENLKIEERFFEANQGDLVSVELECVFRDRSDIPNLSTLGKHLVDIDDDGSVHYQETEEDRNNSEEDEDGDGEEDSDCHGSAEVKVTFRHEKPIRLKGVVEKLGRANAEVNTTCGMHVHLDQRGVSQITAGKRAKRLIKALPALGKLVAPSRLGNQYCHFNRDIYKGVPYRHEYNRYRAINFRTAYSSHRTCEVRLHGGTLDFWKIIGWIDLCHFISRSPAVDKKADAVPQGIRCQLTIEDLIRLEELPSHLRLYVWKRFRQFNRAEADGLREQLVSEDKYALTDGMAIS